MTENPYQSPTEAPANHKFDWKKLFYRGLYIIGGGFAILAALFSIEELPAFKSLPDWVSIAVNVAAFIVIHVGIIIAIVAGIWWVITMEKRGSS